MGTPLLKTEGVKHVVPAFRARFPEALLLADMKTMDGGSFEARSVFEGGGNIDRFPGHCGRTQRPRASALCVDEYRRANPEVPRLVFADILLPHQGPADTAIEVALRMLDAGVDGIGAHLQLDARRADPSLFHSSYLADVVGAVHHRVGAVASVQVVGGLYLEQAIALAKAGLRAFVISGNLGLPDAQARYANPPAEIRGAHRRLHRRRPPRPEPAP